MTRSASRHLLGFFALLAGMIILTHTSIVRDWPISMLPAGMILTFCGWIAMTRRS
jgi:hypothetical protein